MSILCVLQFTPKNRWKVSAYTNFPNFTYIPFLHHFDKGFFIIRLFSFLKLSNNKESKGRNVYIFWKKWFFEKIQFSFISFKGCFYFCSLFTLHEGRYRKHLPFPSTFSARLFWSLWNFLVDFDETFVQSTDFLFMHFGIKLKKTQNLR